MNNHELAMLMARYGLVPSTSELEVAATTTEHLVSAINQEEAHHA